MKKRRKSAIDTLDSFVERRKSRNYECSGSRNREEREREREREREKGRERKERKERRTEKAYISRVHESARESRRVVYCTRHYGDTHAGAYLLRAFRPRVTTRSPTRSKR